MAPHVLKSLSVRHSVGVNTHISDYIADRISRDICKLNIHKPAHSSLSLTPTPKLSSHFLRYNSSPYIPSENRADITFHTLAFAKVIPGDRRVF